MRTIESSISRARRSLAILTTVSALGAPVAASADDAATLRALLVSPDQVPDLAMVHALDADGSRLAGIAADKAASRYLRIRATSLLGSYDRPEIRAVLVGLADRATEDIEVRVHALDAVARLEGPAGEARLVRALASADRAIREVAVIGLERRGARAVLARHRAVERDAAIASRIARFVAR